MEFVPFADIFLTCARLSVHACSVCIRTPLIPICQFQRFEKSCWVKFLIDPEDRGSMFFEMLILIHKTYITHSKSTV